MICPKCGNEMDIFADKCLKCGKSFMNLSISERENLQYKPVQEKRHIKKAKRDVSSSKNETTPIRMTYDNGIAVGEGMSVTGTKQRRGAHRPFLYKY